jgi:hypothetical protein
MQRGVRGARDYARATPSLCLWETNAMTVANLPMIAPARAMGFGLRKGASSHTFLATQGL